MTDEKENNENETGLEKTEGGVQKRIPGIGQVILGELESIGGILTGDSMTQAEGEFNVEVGTIRDEIETDLGEEADQK